MDRVPFEHGSFFGGHSFIFRGSMMIGSKISIASNSFIASNNSFVTRPTGKGLKGAAPLIGDVPWLNLVIFQVFKIG